MSNRETEAELLTELAELDRQIDERRGARHLITVDLEWLLTERDRLRRHLRDVPLIEQHGAALDGAA